VLFRSKAQRIVSATVGQENALWRVPADGAPGGYVTFTLDTGKRARESGGKDPNRPKKALTAYNAFLQIPGLFEQICKDLRAVGDDDELKPGAVGAALKDVKGANPVSPWITIAKELWGAMGKRDKAELANAVGKPDALATLTAMDVYREWVTKHAKDADEEIDAEGEEEEEEAASDAAAE
jgi:hypothetical protein